MKDFAQNRHSKLEKIFSRQGKATKSHFQILNKIEIKSFSHETCKVFKPERILDPSSRTKVVVHEETKN